MFSINEILESKEFERETPKSIGFAVRRVLRGKRREESRKAQNLKKTEQKNIKLAV